MRDGLAKSSANGPPFGARRRSTPLQTAGGTVLVACVLCSLFACTLCCLLTAYSIPVLLSLLSTGDAGGGRHGGIVHDAWMLWSKATSLPGFGRGDRTGPP